MPEDPNGKPPQTRTLDWAALVRKAWGDEYLRRETVYRFPDKREFLSTDSAESGIYRRS